MSEAALVFDNVSFAYDGPPVLNGVACSVPIGTVTAVMGPSGCGKSTLLALAAGLIDPTSGHIQRKHHRAATMFQDPLLLPWRTALANVAFALKADRLPKTQRLQRARVMLDAVGIAREDFSKYPRQLSGGMRQRVALARALVVEPDLLLLDEPFSALDGHLARQMQGLVREVVDRRGISILVVTHDVQEAAAIAEQIVVLSPSPARVAQTLDLYSEQDSSKELSVASTIVAALNKAADE